jgi:flotillin
MSQVKIVPSAPRVRESEGWRVGRPVEDPDKVKRWGLVTAKPSEYLVHVRDGQVTRRSGQGASCFKWPWDSVALVPTSLQELSFQADQVTLERVGVRVSAMVVYRIAEPLLAFRVLNFSYPERAQEKLDETLGAMLAGATRRIVATLSVKECLEKQKSALAERLLADLAPVVAGTGAPEDGTAQGWGVVLDAIEIQEVRVQSEQVFAAMQAPFRAELEQQAELSRLAASRDVSTRRAADERALLEERAAGAEAVERARLRSEAALFEERSRVEKAEAEAKSAARLQALAREEAEAEARTEARLAAFERARREAEAELGVHQLRLAALEAKAAAARVEALTAAEQRRLAAEATRDEGLARAEVSRADAEAAVRSADAEARLLTARQLPALAQAVGSRIGEVKIAHYGPGQPFAPVLGAVEGILELARSAVGERGA